MMDFAGCLRWGFPANSREKTLSNRENDRADDSDTSHYPRAQHEDKARVAGMSVRRCLVHEAPNRGT